MSADSFGASVDLNRTAPPCSGKDAVDLGLGVAHVGAPGKCSRLEGSSRGDLEWLLRLIGLLIIFF